MPNGGCRALRNLEITVTAPGHGEIATVKSIQIIRWLLRGVFHQVLDDESQELHQFSQKLFDKNGFLKDEHIEHDFHKGTGCWGDEVNKGTIHYIVEICVEEPVSNHMCFMYGSHSILIVFSSSVGLVLAVGS